MADDITQADLTGISAGINTAFAAIQSQLVSQALSQTLPLIGNKLDDAVNAANSGLKYIDTIKTQAAQVLTNLAQAATATAAQVQADINAALSPYGLQVVVTKTGDNVTLDFQSTTAQGHTLSYDQDLATDLGVGPLGLHVEGEASASLTYWMHLGVGYDATGGFYVDTASSNEIVVTAHASAPDFSGSAQMGVLNFEADDNGSFLDASFNVNLADGDGKLHLNELSNAFLSATVQATADISVDLAADMGSEWFPSIDAQLNVDWTASGTASSSGFLTGGTAPTVSIDNVTIDLGTFVEDFIKPMLDKLSPILQPLNTALAVLNSDIKALKVVPGWSDIFDHTGKVVNGNDVPDGKITLLDFLKMADPGMDLSPILNAMSTVDKIIDWVEFFTLHSFGSDEYEIGDFAINEDIRNAAFVLENAAPQITEGAETLLAALNGLSGGSYDTIDPITNESGQAIITSIITGGDFDFPILNDPMSIFGLLTGKTVDLMEFNLPHVELGLDNQELARFDVYPGVAIKLVGELGLILDLSGGFDSRGLEQFADTLLNTGATDYAAIFNGFYLSDYDENGDERPEITFHAGFDLIGAFDAQIFEVGVGGGIDGTIEFDLNDLLQTAGSPAGRIYLDSLIDALEANPFSIFTTSGRITAGLTAYAELLNVEVWRCNSPRVTLGSFSFDNSPVLPGQNPAVLPGLGDLTGAGTDVLEVNMGLRAGNRDISDTTDDGESVEIGLAAGKVTIGAFGEQQSFNGVTRIEAHGNLGNDEIVVSESVSVAVVASGGTGDDLILGGSGNDTLSGDADRDYLEGGAGNDSLDGGTEDDILVGGAGADTIRGGDGRDTASYFAAAAGIAINLSTGVASGDEAAGDTFDSIEIFEGSSHDDTMTGAGASVTFVGLSGHDSLNGSSQNDVLIGNDGNDTLDGGTGIDVLVGGKGNDVYYVDSVSDQVHENRINEIGLAEDGGHDAVYSSVNYRLDATETDGGGKTIKSLLDIEDLYLTGSARSGVGNTLDNKITGTTGDDTLDGLTGNDSLIGNLGADVLYGRAGTDTLQGDAGADQLFGDEDSDTLYGGAGNDTLDGGSAADHMEGGADNDTYIVDHAADVIVEALSAGSDTLKASVNYNLDNGVSIELLETTNAAGTDPIELRGNDYAQTVRGNAGDNVLEGRGGADTIEGGSGTDKVTYRSSAFGVTIDLGLATQQGGDAQGDIYTSIEIHEGSGWADDLKGNASANHLRGLGDADLLYGYAGNDTLFGGAGLDTIDGGSDADSMVGGADSDTYYVDSLSDIVDEVSDGGSGDHDLINANLNYSIASNSAVEDLTITGSANYAQGNGNANIIISTNHADTIDGGGGGDLMVGKGGDDTYLIDSLGDEIIENSDEGTDLIKLHVSSLVAATIPVPDPIATFVMNTWASNVEHLDMDVEATTWRINVTGNSLSNRITANQRENVINALGGNDTIIAGGGQDSIYGGDGDDRAEFAWDGQANEDLFDGGADSDVLKMDWSAAAYNIVYYSDANGSKFYAYAPTAGSNTVMNFVNVERFALYGGSSYDDLRGGALGDTLSGGAHNDRLLGYTGTGTYDGGADVDYVEATIATTSSLHFNLSLSASQSAEQVSNLGTGIETRWRGIEYVQLTTAAGNDTLDARLDTLTNVRTWDQDGNDFNAGAGNDTFLINFKSAGYHYFNADAGTDKLYMDWRDATYDIRYFTDSAGQKQMVYAPTVGTDSVVHYQSVERFELYGGSGNDDLRGGALDDTLSGGNGTDRLWGDAGKGVYDGGDGTDVVVATIASAVGANFNLAFIASQASEQVSNAGTSIETRWKGIELVDLTTGAGDDTLDARLSTFTNVNTIWHEDGNDFRAGAGNDTFMVNLNSAGYHFFDAGLGTDKVYIDWRDSTYGIRFFSDNAGQKQMVYHPSAGQDTVVHYVQADRFEIYGGSANDDLRGGVLDDTLSGGAGTDRLWGDTGTGQYDGGAGTDLVIATIATTAGDGFNLSFSASQGSEQVSNGGTSLETRWKGIELVKLTTGAGDDTLDARLDDFTNMTDIWQEDGNEFTAGDGDDTFLVNHNAAGYHYFNAGAGTDKVYIDWSASDRNINYFSDAQGQKQSVYHPGIGTSTVVHYVDADRFEIYGGSGDDDLRGGVLDDTLSGGAGTDHLIGGTGKGVYDGGDGLDFVEATVATTGTRHFNVSLSASQATEQVSNVGTSIETRWKGVEFVRLTTAAGNDTLDARLDTQTNTRVWGEDGNEFFAGNGNDTFMINWKSAGFHDFAGQGGTDKLVLDWSDATYNIRFYDDPDGRKQAVYTPFAGQDSVVRYVDVERFEIYGGVNNDDLRGGALDDTLSGGDGNDKLVASTGTGNFDGGAGMDRVIADIRTGANADLGLAFSLALAATQTGQVTVNSGTGVETRWQNVEVVQLTTGSGSDTLDARMSVMTDTRSWDVDGNRWTSNNGDDSFLVNYRAFGSHEWWAGDGTDTLTVDWSEATYDVRYYTDANVTTFYVYTPTYGGNANVSFHDVERFNVTGGVGNDDLRGGAQADTLSGGVGDDKLMGYAGKGTFAGGDGSDYVEATIASASGLNFTLSLAAAQAAEQVSNSGTAIETRWSGIEAVNLTLGAGNDTLDARMSTMTNTRTWAAGGSRFDGGAGNDTFKLNFNSRGNHYFEGGDGTDTLVLDYSGATNGISYGGYYFYAYDSGGGYNTAVEFYNVERFDLTGGGAGDNLVGGAQNDSLRGNGGDDNLDGGDGEDTVYYSGDADDYTVTDNGGGSYIVADKRASSDGTDTLSHIERIVFGDNVAPTNISLSAASVAENAANGTVVANLSTTDADAHDVASYTLLNNGGGRFAISNGQLVVANSALLNRESLSSVSIGVRVTDAASHTFDKTFTIAINDVDEFNVGPVSDTTSAADVVTENVAVGTAVGIKVTASDADATHNAITYSLDTNAGGRFKIDSDGTVRTAAAIDREATGASQTIVVRATSADGSSSTKSFTIGINDVDEFNTGAIGDSNGAANAVSENVAVGTATGIKASASDGDATHNAITYSLDNTAGGRFKIDSDGTVRTAAAIDREALGASQTIVIRATSADGSSSTKSFTIGINDVDEANTTAISDLGSAADAVTENVAVGTAVGIQARATDADATNNAITYSLDNNAGGRFKIDSDGTVRTAAAIDRETTGASQTIVIRATSADGSFSTRTATVAIADIDEFDVATPSDTNVAANKVSENGAANAAVGITVHGVDSDATNNTISYSLVDDANGLVSIDANGVVHVTRTLDRETDGPTISFVARAASSDGSSSTQAFSFAIADVAGLKVKSNSKAQSIVGSGEADTIDAGAGNDTISGLGDIDKIDGGKDVDTVSYADKSASVSVALDGSKAVTVTVGGVAEDTLKNVENVIGGSGADSLAGDKLANALTGGAGNDTLRGGAGKDTLDGGKGSDTADYSDKTSAVTVTLNGSKAITVKVGSTKEDSIKNIENVTGGTKNDKLTGDKLANLLDGNTGDDTLDGGKGNDTLDGGAGKDQLKGGAGKDVFVFDDKLGSSNIDTITDFVAKDDTIRLDSAVMTALGDTWTEAMFIAVKSGNKAKTDDQHIIYDKKTGNLWYDADGNTSHGDKPIQIATLTTHPGDVTWHDFEIV